MTEWHRVVFSDESRFCLSSDSRRVRVWRRRGERFNPAAIVERPTVRQGGIMVLGAIAYDSRSPLLRIQGTMTVQRFVDDVLRPVTLPYLQGVPNALYQQDNARPHTSRISQQALQDVQMLPWPPYSPDLSPIEHVWDIIGRRLHALPQPRSEDELWQMVEREWRAIPQDAIRTLIDSLPRRVAACIAVRGGPTPDVLQASAGNRMALTIIRTISRRLVANGLHSCRPLRRLPLTPPNRRQRLEWCRDRSTWMTEWHRVVFSDESRFCLSSDSPRVRVWRRRGERSNPAAIVERPTVRQRGIMVWGAIAYDSRSPLLRIQGTMTAQRYVDDVLRPVTLPYLQGVPNALYQQDNARPHTARISQQALQDVQMLPWPPYSPDLSPIEHVWDIIGRRLHALPQPRSEDELWQMKTPNTPSSASPASGKLMLSIPPTTGSAQSLLRKSSDVTRSSVQKSVCVLSRLPLYGLIQTKLEVITQAYFAERDFSQVALLRETFATLNTTLSDHLLLGPQVFYVHVVQAMIIMVLFFKSPVKDLCTTILTICSLFPGMLEKEGLLEAGCHLAGQHPSTPQVRTSQDPEYLEVFYDGSTIPKPPPLPTNNSNMSEFSQESADSQPAVAEDLSDEDDALLLEIDSLLSAPTPPDGAQLKVNSSSPVAAAEDLEDLGLPLAIFTKVGLRYLKEADTTGGSLIAGTIYWGLPSGTIYWGLPSGTIYWGLPSGTIHWGLPSGTIYWGLPSGTIYWGLPSGTIHWGLPSGTIYWGLPSGTIYWGLPSGTIHWGLPSGTMHWGLPSGTIYWGLPSGTIYWGLPSGTIYWGLPSGTIYWGLPSGTIYWDLPSGTIYWGLPSGTIYWGLFCYVRNVTHYLFMWIWSYYLGSVCHPYLSLPYLDYLTDVNIRSFVVGATNVLFRQKSFLFDVIIEMEGGLVEIADPELRRQLHLSTEDLRFADHLVRTVTDSQEVSQDGRTRWEGGDEWLRAQFRLYLLSLLRVSQLEENYLLICYLVYTFDNSNYLKHAVVKFLIQYFCLKMVTTLLLTSTRGTGHDNHVRGHLSLKDTLALQLGVVHYREVVLLYPSPYLVGLQLQTTHMFSIDGIGGVLVHEALGSVLETLDGGVLPPLVEVAVFVVLPACTTPALTVSIDDLYSASTDTINKFYTLDTLI
ncbi:AVL9 [Cordylochernes scorpioides]|uniref:AVL9 n=1 Tax=Cordylochernes scorpioides TaxID=51811 RepID=A0ABY6LFV5_9ARAC|nr:AVL9 [Cordylochernes scorpioides]